MSSKQLGRWLELAGIGKQQPNKQNNIPLQESHGNEFVKSLLVEAPEEEEEIETKAGGDLGDSEKVTLSNSSLVKGLKTGAVEIADAIPLAMNDEFAELINKIKDLTQDKEKVAKLIRFVDKLSGLN